MVQEQITPIRIKFQKFGSLIYISHLDLVRTMQRIMIRAGINIGYSEGFNPQPKMVFTPPLPIGTESMCEYVDIKVLSQTDTEEIKKRLTENFPNEMRVCKVYIPTTKLSQIAYIDYKIRINSTNIGKETVKRTEELFKSECNIVKSSKNGDSVINVSGYIKSIKPYLENDELVIDAILCSDSRKYLNPELLVKAIKNKLNLLSSGGANEYYSIVRKEMMFDDLSVFE